MTGNGIIRRRLQLLHRIHCRYQTFAETVPIGDRTLQFTRIADPNRVLDEIAREEDRREKLTGIRVADPQHLPYWAELWDSACALAQVIARASTQNGSNGVARPALTPCHNIPAFSLSPCTQVLDLGCGMGLAGTVAAACGAGVLFADLESPALLFARLNSLPWHSQVRTRRLDWRVDRLGERFDLILGADIIYEAKQWEHLDPFFKAHLAPNGTLMLAEPNRQTGDRFIPWMQARGWKVQVTQERVETRQRGIRIMWIKG